MKKKQLIGVITAVVIVLLTIALLLVFLLPDRQKELTYGEWEIVKAATCTEAGEKRRTSVDGTDTQTEIIPAVGHTTGGGIKGK